MWLSKVMAMVAKGVAALALVPAFSPAWAVLGGAVAGVQAEQARMGAMRATTLAAPGVSMHDLRLPDGSSIRQFANAQGIVFAVAWSTRVKPDFEQLLGRYAADFDAGAAVALRKQGLQRSVAVEHGDLALQSGGRPGAFVGKAWLKSQTPTGFGADAIR